MSENDNADVTSKSKKKSWFRRHKILTVIFIIILLIIIVSVANGSSSNKTASTSSSSSSNTTQTQKASTTTAKTGQAVRDGKFEFTVNSVKCGETSVGSQYLNVQAQGQFCRLNLSVKNIGNESQTLDYSSQYAFNAAGQKYSSNSQAAIYADSSNASSAWYNDINPGNTVTGDIFYDIPKDATLTKAELHDSALSNGVSVDLQ